MLAARFRRRLQSIGLLLSLRSLPSLRSIPVFAPAPIPLPQLPPRPREEEQEPPFYFGRCSRPLKEDYSRPRTEDEWAAVRRALLTHDDVAWSIKFAEGSESWGDWTANARDAAGLHPADREGLWWLGSVPGVIKTPDPMPPEAACGTKGITEVEYIDVADQVAADRANPPDFKLCFLNCKTWADRIEDLTEGEGG